MIGLIVILMMRSTTYIGKYKTEQMHHTIVNTLELDSCLVNSTALIAFRIDPNSNELIDLISIFNSNI